MIQRDGPLDARPGRRHRRRHRGRARVRAPQRRRAPRREARQRAHHADGPGEGHRLRHRPRAAPATASPRPARSWAPPPTSRPSRRRASRSTAAPTSTRSASCSTRWSPASPPFTGDSPGRGRVQARARGAGAAEPARARRSRPSSSTIILTALAKDPDDRYQSADDLRADLLRFRRGQPLVGGADHRGRSPTIPTAPRHRRRSHGRPHHASATRCRSQPTTTARAPHRATAAPIIGAIVAASSAARSASSAASLVQPARRRRRRRRRSRSPSVVGPDVEPTARGSCSTAPGLRGRSVDRAAERRRSPRASSCARTRGAATKLEKGETVMLTVSDGAGRSQIPDVAAARRFDERRRPLQDQAASTSSRAGRGERHVDAGHGDPHRPAAGRRVEPRRRRRRSSCRRGRRR